MKSEKLELLLNKVVELNRPDVLYCKGFLYKDHNGYYIKVVEAIIGSLTYNQIYYLKSGDEQFIIQADKPKLMRVSLKSWHYRLIKYVLRDNAPTPKTMQNGCPYFWLLMFSLLASPFVFVVKTIWFLLLFFPKILYWSLERIVDSWITDVDDAQAYEYYYNGKYCDSKYKMPVTARLYFDKTDTDFISLFLCEKYKIDRNQSVEEFNKKLEEMRAKWDAWREKVREDREKLDEIQRLRKIEQSKKREEYERKREISKAKWDARMKPIKSGLRSIREAFTFDPTNLKSIIRRTKQFFGAVITLALLVGTYFVVNFLAYGFMAFVDFSIDNWEIYAGIGVFIVLVGIGYVLYVIVGGWLQSVVNKYQSGRRVWYIEPLIYVIWYPVKYVSIFIAYSIFYVILIPIKYIFYNFLWKLIIVNLAKLIWGGLCSLGRGIAGSTGIFGEYFGASYSDYCPGIEWVDSEEEK
jgi:hypothetical protein